MSFTDFAPPVNPPTQADFTSWVRTAIGIPSTVIPDNSVWFTYAYNAALTITNPVLQVAGTYDLALYNLGGDNLINWAQDSIIPPATSPVNFPGTNTPYMAYLRDQYKVSAFVPGVIQSSNDESTGQSMELLEQYTGYTLANLQNLKTPWGRVYLAFAADVGPLWGMN